MNNYLNERVEAQELCQAAMVSIEIVIEIVEHGIVEPVADLQGDLLRRDAKREVQCDYGCRWRSHALTTGR